MFHKAQAKKVLKVNELEPERLSHHIGRFPVVLIAPQDIALIYDGSETRRKFFDSIISQIDSAYLEDLLKYNHALKQRNALLKQFSETGIGDKELAEPYDRILIERGKRIYDARSSFVKTFGEVFAGQYGLISDQKEVTEITYVSDFSKPDYEVEFARSWQKDLIRQRTNLGVHKDRYDFSIEGYGLKHEGSQGQQKSFLLALRLAQFEIIKSAKGFAPVLLLDDVFDKLDDGRINRLLQMVSDKSFGQLFITDARPERSRSIIVENGLSAKVLEINSGRIVGVEDYEKEKAS